MGRETSFPAEAADHRKVALGLASRADGGDGVHLIAAGDEAVVYELKRELVGKVVEAVSPERCAQPVGADLVDWMVEGRVLATTCGWWNKREVYENVRTGSGYVCSARTADGSKQPTACLAHRSRHRSHPDQTIGVGGARKSSFASARLRHGVIVTPGIPTSQVIISHDSSSPLCERATSRTQRIRRGLPASSSAGTPFAPTIGQSTVCSSYGVYPDPRSWNRAKKPEKKTIMCSGVQVSSMGADASASSGRSLAAWTPKETDFLLRGRREGFLC